MGKKKKELCWVAEKEMFLKGEAGGRKLLAKNALVFGKVTLLREQKAFIHRFPVDWLKVYMGGVNGYETEIYFCIKTSLLTLQPYHK